ncbi:MAG TPA: hypothetical protein VGV61_02900 [Thermoanaerobaculia bacterium]|jgi:hypothetical protein|nr:hypothetical protein [Thermoanaerobaculia bacterium]
MRRLFLLAALAIVHPALAHADEIAVSPALPSTTDAVHVHLTGFACTSAVSFAPPSIGATSVVVRGSFSAYSPCTPNQPWSHDVELGKLAAGSYLLLVEINDIPTADRAFTVDPPRSVLMLHDGRFTATLRWTDPRNGHEEVAAAVPLATQSGYFWFFDSGNVEVTLKVLDARPVNGHFWIFVASMTTVPFTLTVEDRASPCAGPVCNLRFYESPGGNRNFIDFDAFF